VTSTDPQRPNVLVVVSDDQGPWAFPGAGCPELVMPALAGLAAEGTRFENSFCASPVCSPARASLMTGRMPSAHGVHDWVRGESYGIVEDRDVDYVEPFAATPEALAGDGWVCGHSGKWHLGTARMPSRGFTHWYAHRSGDGPYVGAPVWRDGVRVSEPRYITEAITEEALGFLDGQHGGRDGRPFYLSVNYTAPHSPWVGQHPQRWLDLYADCDFASCPQEQPHPWFSWEPGPVGEAMADPLPSLQGYFASLSAMDAGLGTLLRWLTDHSARQSTIVAFTSDNGFSCGHHGIWGKGNATWPLNMWEESVRTPLVVSQPGRIASGAVREDLVSACDLHPTLLELCAVAVPEDPLAAGRSVAGLLLAGESAPREAVMAFDEYGGVRMVRTADWKYVARAEGPTELYHLADDPQERENLAGVPSCAAVQDDLHGVLHDWFAAHSDPALDAYRQPVSGRGQLRPLSDGLGPEQTYQAAGAERLPQPSASDGTR
jgi:choline-sulfatase